VREVRAILTSPAATAWEKLVAARLIVEYG
jgi:hypothetical protein